MICFKIVYSLFLIPLLFACTTKNTSSSNPSSSSSESEDIAQPVFDHLEVVDPKTTYELDEPFSLSEDMKVLAHYSDGSKFLIDDDKYDVNYSSYDEYHEGQYQITLSVPEVNGSVNYTVNVKPLKKFNVLWIGNSHGDDSVKWSHEVAKDLGLDFMVANLYIGGCTLDTHYNNLLNNNKAYDFRTYRNGVWQTTSNYSIQEAINYNNTRWDFAVIHQQGSNSGIPSTFTILNPYLDLLRENLPSYTKIVYMGTWAYSQFYCEPGDLMDVNFGGSQIRMYSEQQNVYKTIIEPNEKIYKLIPTGTAIQNARSSYLGDGLSRDLSHLTYDLGRYIAAMSFVVTLSGKNPSDIIYRPDGVTQKQKMIAIESVMNSQMNKFSVTESVYKE